MKALRKWIAIYLAILVSMVLVAKYPDLLAGQFPQFAAGELSRTLVMAALGTGLIEIIIYRVKQLRNRSTMRQKR